MLSDFLVGCFGPQRAPVCEASAGEAATGGGQREGPSGGRQAQGVPGGNHTVGENTWSYKKFAPQSLLVFIRE